MKKRSPRNSANDDCSLTRMFKRAVRLEDKGIRRQELLDSARRLFREKEFAEISVMDICRGAGVAKGTFYLYFATKEAAYLALQTVEIEEWLNVVDEQLRKQNKKIDKAELCGVLVESIGKRPDLPKYLCLLHGVLERNVSDAEILAFKLFLRSRIGTSVTLLVERVKNMTEDLALKVILYVYSDIIGAWQLANPPAAVRKVLEREKLMEFEMSFETLLQDHIGGYLRGSVG